MVKFGPVKCGPAEFGPLKFGPVKFGPVKFGPVKFGPVKFLRCSNFFVICAHRDIINGSPGPGISSLTDENC